MTTVNGLPAHILLVHAIVVLLPLTALLLVLTAAWPAARRRLAGPNALLALLVVVLVPVTTSAGEWLQGRVPPSELVRDHTELGDTAIYYAIPIAVLALVVWWRNRQGQAGLAVTRVVTVLALVAGAAGVWGMYRIGDSGSKAAWTGNFSQTSTRPGGRGEGHD